MALDYSAERAAFDSCPSRTVVRDDNDYMSALLRGGGMLNVVCAKYRSPGIHFTTEQDFTDPEKRGEAALRLGCLGCEFNSMNSQDFVVIDGLHPTIKDESGELFLQRHYPEATQGGFQVVRNRLYDLTGSERSFEAARDLIFPSVAPKIDKAHQQGIIHLLHAVGNIRNELSHGDKSDLVNRVTRPVAISYLNMASLAMSHLDMARNPKNS